MNINFSFKKNIFKPNRIKRTKKFLTKYGIALVNLVLVISVVGFLARGTHSPTLEAQQARTSSDGEKVAVLDEISAADIAVNIAMAARLPETDQVRNQADSRNALVNIAVSDDVVVNKPQIITAATIGGQTRKDIKQYVVQMGDSVQSLAERYNVSSDSIRWSNGLSGNALTVGSTILLPPANRNGIVYLVSNGDTIEQLAEKYKTNAEKIVAFNDLELTRSLPVGEYILIPDGERPFIPRPFFAGDGNVSVLAGFVPRFGGNGYSFGYCTYWAAGRRAEAGSPIPNNWGNANTWDDLARMSGYRVDNIPEAGSIFQTDGYGHSIYHVAYVESVNSDGSIVISEMNFSGWNVVNTRVISPAEVPRYNYIH